MGPSEDLSSSPAPKSASLEEELAYYKAQYEQLEAELQDFQASSRELEAELEKDIETAEKRERELQEKVDSLGFEVDEWKTKYKQSKTEANNAQNTLQKEITNLRDSNRTLQLKLRDIEVANDDYERQARNTTSSLEDLESKYNIAIERGVMLEEEIKVGEQERETLRIETQRLRDELSDLRIEADIIQERLRLAEETIDRHHQRKPSQLESDVRRPPSPLSETATSATSTSTSWPTASTPPLAKSEVSELQTTPPSPPLSDAPTQTFVAPSTPLLNGHRTTVPPSIRKPALSAMRPPRHSRGPSIPTISRPPPSAPRSRMPSRPSIGPEQTPIPRSGSLYQIRGLIGKMQKLEERVHTVRSKLPAPTSTPPRASPRSSALGQQPSDIPATVTVRSNRKRTSNSTQGSSTDASYSTAPISRLSFGPSAPRPDRPSSALSRPSSRASVASAGGGSNSNGGTFHYPMRPASRNSISGARTPQLARPRSSISGTYVDPARCTTPGPRLPHPNTYSGSATDQEPEDGFPTPTPAPAPAPAPSVTPSARRSTLEKGFSSIPMPSGIPRRQSGQGLVGMGRRQSSGGGGEMLPPSSARGKREERKLSEVGETC